MTQSRDRRWLCVVASILATGVAGSVAADESLPTCAEEPTPPKKCKESCTYRCDCKRGIYATDYKNLILLNVGSTFAGRVDLEYERALHPRASIFGAFSAVVFDSLGNSKLVGFGGLIGGRVNLVGRAPEGIWFAWQVGGFRRNERASQDVQLRGIQTGGMFGWTGVWRRFAFTLGAGGTYTYGRVTVGGQSVNDQEWNPWLKLGLGVAFGK